MFRAIILVFTLLAAVVAMPSAATAEQPVEAMSTTARVTRLAWSPGTVRAGRASRVEVRVKAVVASVNTIEVVVRDAEQQVVWQTGWSQQTFRRGQTRTFRATWTAPPDTPAGVYTTSVQVLDTTSAEVTATRQTSLRLTAAPTPPALTPTPTPRPPTTTPTPPATGLAPEEQTFLNLINQYRQSRGLTPLALNQSLVNAARWHSNDMATNGYFSHTDSLGRDPFRRMADFGYTANTYKGENIAAGYSTAAAVMAGWQASPGHNGNMLNPNYRTIGIGLAQRAGSPYGTYWTTTFGGQ
jgi:uncharacterized protein YkwD